MGRNNWRVQLVRLVEGDRRRWHITREVFERYGATPDCPRCNDWVTRVRSNKPHTQVCRDRMERVLASVPVYGPRILDSRTRQEHRLRDPEFVDLSGEDRRGIVGMEVDEKTF